MNIACRLCRSWLLRRRIQAQTLRLQRVVFAWSHDPDLALSLPAAAARAVAQDGKSPLDDSALRVILYRHLVHAYLNYREKRIGVWAFPSAARMGTDAPLAHRVHAALQDLDEQQRLIVALVDLGGCSYDETARILGLSRASLLDSLCNARVHLKTRLLGRRSSNQPRAWRRLP